MCKSKLVFFAWAMICFAVASVRGKATSPMSGNPICIVLHHVQDQVIRVRLFGNITCQAVARTINPRSLSDAHLIGDLAEDLRAFRDQFLFNPLAAKTCSDAHARLILPPKIVSLKPATMLPPTNMSCMIAWSAH